MTVSKILLTAIHHSDFFAPFVGSLRTRSNTGRGTISTRLMANTWVKVKSKQSQVMTHILKHIRDLKKSTCQQWWACFTKCTFAFYSTLLSAHITLRIRHVEQVE